MYTLYYFAFLLVFQNIAALVWIARQSEIENRTSKIRNWLFSQLAILVLYLPWAPIAFRQATDPPVPPWRSFTTLPNVLTESFSALAFGQSLDLAVTWPSLLFIIGLFVFVILTERRAPSASLSLFLLGYTFIPLFLIYALSLWKPLYHVRYIFIYSPGFYMLLAIGIRRISDFRFQTVDSPSRITYHVSRIMNRASRFTPSASLRAWFYISRFTFYAFLLLLTAASAFSAYNFWFDPKYAHDDLRGAITYLTEHWRPGDAVLVNAGYTYTAFDYYSDLPVAWRGRLAEYATRNTGDGALVLQTGSIGGSASLGWGSPASDFYATTEDTTRAALGRVFAAHPRVWMLRLYDTVVDPDGVIRAYLVQRGRIIDDQGFAGESYARVQGYLTTRAPLTALPATATRREVLLGNRIMLLGFEPASVVARAGAPLDVDVYWQAQEPTNIDQRLFAGLFAENGNLVARSDETPLGNALGTARWTPGEILRAPVRLMVPTAVPPGNYILRVALYNPLTNEPLDAQGEWVVENSQIKLTNVRMGK